MNSKFDSFINNINISRHICNHLISEKHTNNHRKFVGIGIMVIGVSIAKVSATCSYFVIHFIGDISGYFIHAVGAIPFLKTIEENG